MKKIEKLKKRAIDYVQENKVYIITISIIYFVLLLFCFVLFLFYPTQVPGESWILDKVWNRKLFMDSVGLDFLIYNYFINVLLLLIILVLGFVFSVWAIFYIFYKISLFGLSLARFIQYDYMDQLYLLLAHMFFSLPVIFLTLALSLKLTISLYEKIFKNTDIKIIHEIKGIFKFFFLIIVPLLLVTYITEFLVIKYIF